MNDEETPLAQFQNYYGSLAQRAVEGEADYVRLREAFYAGYRARPRPPIEPSRDALSEYPGRGFLSAAPNPDYIQRGTVTGRIGPSMPRRDVDYADKARRFHEVYGVTPDKVAGPSPEVLERIHDQLRRDGQVEYPVAEDTNPGLPAVTRADTALMPSVPGLEHTETVWSGEIVKTEAFDLRYGAPGPVPTPLSAQEDERG